MSNSPFNCVISAIDRLSDDTISITFSAKEGTPFKGVAAGAHIDVYAFMGALTRQYSLWNWSEDGTSASIAVKREESGRGGSRFMHTLEVGEEVDIAGPRNHFAVSDQSKEVLLIAGGIGITPITAMACELADSGTPFQLYYLARSKEAAAFLPILEGMRFGERLHTHFDETSGVFDMEALIQNASPETHVYFCGPEPLLNIVLDLTRAWPSERVHYERFAALPVDTVNNKPFKIQISSSGAVFDVAADQTALKVLDDNGIFIPYACENGICGSCMVDVLEGEVDHRDDIISDAEKAENSVMCVCVSRAKSAKLVLDL